jgi:glycerate dehydrogenase
METRLGDQQDGHGGACLPIAPRSSNNVPRQEPPHGGNPQLCLDLPNFLLTQHIVWSSREAMQRPANQLTDNLDAFARGQDHNRVA